MDKLEALQHYFGHSSFRPGQERLIDALLAGRDVLGIMPTGAGKSLCFQIPALISPGLTLVVSPLISLMQDQVQALNACGGRAAYLNSSLTPAQQAEALRRAARGCYKLIYVAPERLQSPSFISFARRAPLDFLAVDEAHCVSQWGQDFRPSYLHIAPFVESLPQRPPLAALTATATPQVRADIQEKLALRDPCSLVSGFDRPNLHFCVRRPSDKLKTLLTLLRERAGCSGIVYCATRRNVEEVQEALQTAGVEACRYHAGLTEEERHQAQDDFLYDRCRVMVATNAFGMGIDKSNVSFVIHYNMPKDIEGYYQEAGRAGRDGAPADCILLYAKRDVSLANWMIDRKELEEGCDPVLLEETKARDRERLKQMTFYSTTKGCLRRFILRYFGEADPGACGHCSNCEGAVYKDEVRKDEVRKETPRTCRREDLVALAGLSPQRQEERRSRRRRALALSSSHSDLLNRLKQTRSQLAAQEGVPAYVIFSDATLLAMAESQPTNEAEMRQISGVGEVKLRRFGADFIRTVSSWRREQGLDL